MNSPPTPSLLRKEGANGGSTIVRGRFGWGADFPLFASREGGQRG
jgi:hypothetical protein